MNRILAILCLLLATILTPLSARAYCTFDGTGGGSSPYIYTFPAFTATFDPTVPNGTVLASSSVTAIANYSTLWFECYPEVGYVVYQGVTGSQATYNTYTTSIPGVGLRISQAATGY